VSYYDTAKERQKLLDSKNKTGNKSKKVQTIFKEREKREAPTSNSSDSRQLPQTEWAVWITVSCEIQRHGVGKLFYDCRGKRGN